MFHIILAVSSAIGAAYFFASLLLNFPENRAVMIFRVSASALTLYALQYVLHLSVIEFILIYVVFIITVHIGIARRFRGRF